MARKSSLFIVPAMSVLAMLAAESGIAYLLPAEEIIASIGRRRARLEFSTLVVEGTHQKGGEEPEPVWDAIIADRGRRVEHKRPGGTEGNRRLAPP